MARNEGSAEKKNSSVSWIYQKRQHQGKHGVAGVRRDARSEFDDGTEHALQLTVASEYTGDASAAGAGGGDGGGAAVGRCGYIVLLFRSAVGHGSVSAAAHAIAAAGAAGGVGASGSSRVLRFRFEVVRGQGATAVGGRRANDARSFVICSGRGSVALFRLPADRRYHQRGRRLLMMMMMMMMRVMRGGRVNFWLGIFARGLVPGRRGD